MISSASVDCPENDLVSKDQITETAANLEFGCRSFRRNSGQSHNTIGLQYLSRTHHQRREPYGLEHHIKFARAFSEALERIGSRRHIVGSQGTNQLCLFALF